MPWQWPYWPWVWLWYPVRMQARADRARRAGAEGLLKDHALAGKCVNAGRVDDAIAVAVGNAAPVVGNEK